jgi:hypothetical protein
VRVWALFALVASAISFAPAPALAQPSNPFFGSWVGTLEQKAAGGRRYTSFTFNIVIGPNGNQIGGTTRSDSPDNKTHYVTNFVSVVYTPPVLQYTDSRPMFAEPPTAWCTKQVALTVSGDDLTGTWTAPGCNDGSLHVRRLDTVFAEDVAEPAARLFRYTNPTGELFLFLKRHSDMWRVLPAQIGADELASLQLGGEMRESFVVSGSEPARVAAGPDGGLYLVQGGSAWPLRPRDMADLDLTTVEAGSTWHVDLRDGALPDAFSGGSAAALPAGNADGEAPAANSDAAGTSDAGSGPPETLTDNVRADVLTAVNRANAAWATASQTLDPSGLSGAVAGDELANDLAELDTLRAQHERKNNVNTAFSVLDVTLDAPGHAVVHTSETWYAEIYDLSTGRLVQRTAPGTYAETYYVSYLDGGWIVTLNQV